jgi:hypothetical protein
MEAGGYLLVDDSESCAFSRSKSFCRRPFCPFGGPPLAHERVLTKHGAQRKQEFCLVGLKACLLGLRVPE